LRRIPIDFPYAKLSPLKDFWPQWRQAAPLTQRALNPRTHTQLDNDYQRHEKIVA
jgi:hypothetical protein